MPMADLVEAMIQDLEMDREEVLRLLHIYLRSCWEDFGAASDALALKDPGKLHARAHNIKGASASLMIEDARSAAEALELAGKAGNFSDAPAHLSELRAALTRVQTAVERA
jgi:HPt (histidine-containing phosphotransfer) domain-containing protein